MAQWLGCWISDQGVPGSNPGGCSFHCVLEQVTFTPCLVLVKPRKRSTDDCDEAGDYVVPNVLSPRDLVSRPDNMDETVPHSLPSQRPFSLAEVVLPGTPLLRPSQYHRTFLDSGQYRKSPMFAAMQTEWKAFLCIE